MPNHLSSMSARQDRAARRHYFRNELPQQSDEKLMAQFQAGTPEAFDLLVERYSPRLQRFVYRFVRDQSRCQDIVQEAFVRVYRNRFSYRPIARFSTWIYTIARNLARSEYRRRCRSKVVPLHMEAKDGAEFEMELPDPGPSPERHFAGRHRWEMFERALDSLPEKYQEVIILREVQELSYQEIADITGLPLGTVKSRINRARVRLQSMLEPVGEELRMAA